jgi:chromosome segregation ATPase
MLYGLVGLPPLQMDRILDLRKRTDNDRILLEAEEALKKRHAQWIDQEDMQRRLAEAERLRLDAEQRLNAVDYALKKQHNGAIGQKAIIDAGTVDTAYRTARQAALYFDDPSLKKLTIGVPTRAAPVLAFKKA